MTVSTTATRELDINRLCLLAYRQAGLLHLSQAMTTTQGSYARDMLETVVDQLQARGVFARAQGFYLLDPLIVGDDSYSLPGNALDVIGDAKYITAADDPANPKSETTITQMSAKQWQDLSGRSAEGYPSKFYVHRESTLLEVRLWPKPNQAGAIRFRIHRLLADNDDGTRTVDLERPWAKFLIYETSYHLAVGHSLPAERRRELKLTAESTFRECKGFSTSHLGGEMVLDHPTAWDY